MEKKTKLIKKVLPAVVAAGMLVGQPQKAHADGIVTWYQLDQLNEKAAQVIDGQTADKANLMEPFIYTNETSFDPSYVFIQPEFYDPSEALKLLNDIITSGVNDLSKQSGKDFATNGSKVVEEVCQYLNRMNVNSKALAFTYKHLARKSLTNFKEKKPDYENFWGFEKKELSEKDKKEYKGLVNTPDIQEMLREFFDLQILLRFNTPGLEVFFEDYVSSYEDDRGNKIEKYDNYRRYNPHKTYKIYTGDYGQVSSYRSSIFKNFHDGHSDERQSMVMNNIRSYLDDQYNGTWDKFSHEFYGVDRRDKGIFGPIKTISERQVSEINQATVMNTLNEKIAKAAECLPDVLGPINVRIGLVSEFALTYAMDCMLEHLKEIGYNVDNFKAGIMMVKTSQQIQDKGPEMGM